MCSRRYFVWGQSLQALTRAACGMVDSGALRGSTQSMRRRWMRGAFHHSTLVPCSLCIQESLIWKDGRCNQSTSALAFLMSCGAFRCHDHTSSCGKPWPLPCPKADVLVGCAVLRLPPTDGRYRIPCSVLVHHLQRLVFKRTRYAVVYVLLVLVRH